MNERGMIAITIVATILWIWLGTWLMEVPKAESLLTFFRHALGVTAILVTPIRRRWIK